MDPEKLPKIVIKEQPASTRFRYESEGRSGVLTGVRSRDGKKTYPAIEVVNLIATGIVRVSCVTSIEPYRPHPHELTGFGCSDGFCQTPFTTESEKPTIVTFPDIGIQGSTRNQVARRLAARSDNGINPYGTPFNAELDRKINLHSMRLCFEILSVDDDMRILEVEPTVSQIINNTTVPKEINIVNISSDCSPCWGGKEITILCSKFSIDDIEVHFREDGNPEPITCEIIRHHHNAAVVIRTPKYRLENIEEPCKGFIELYRPTTETTSKPVNFSYDPDSYEVLVRRKRQKLEEFRMYGREQKQPLCTPPQHNTPSTSVNYQQGQQPRQHNITSTPNNYQQGQQLPQHNITSTSLNYQEGQEPRQHNITSTSLNYQQGQQLPQHNITSTSINYQEGQEPRQHNITSTSLNYQQGQQLPQHNITSTSINYPQGHQPPQHNITSTSLNQYGFAAIH